MPLKWMPTALAGHHMTNILLSVGRVDVDVSSHALVNMTGKSQNPLEALESPPERLAIHLLDLWCTWSRGLISMLDY